MALFRCLCSMLPVAALPTKPPTEQLLGQFSIFESSSGPGTSGGYNVIGNNFDGGYGI